MTGQLKVLFVCAMNKKRSPTAEQIYKNDARLEVRSAGVRSEAKRRISEQDLKWADVVFVMERTHKTWIKAKGHSLKEWPSQFPPQITSSQQPSSPPI